MTPTAVLGIDPGKTGACALLDASGAPVGILDFSPPRLARELEAWLDLYPFCAYLERVHAMPKQGVSTTFTFGEAFGWWKGWLDGAGVPWQLVEPRAWMTGLIPPKRDANDKPGLLVARRKFPTMEKQLARKGDHNRADALLIAWYGWKQEKKG